MKKLLILLTLLALAACGPKTYLGPLDSPIGNWKGVVSKYYFNGENVYETPDCMYSAISFYKDSLCCIEDIKGVFRWTYSGDSLVVDTTIWKVVDLSGRKMDLDYLGIIEKPATNAEEGVAVIGDGIENDESESENSQGTQEPQDPQNPQETIEYKGQTIETDGKKHWYLNAEGKTIQCFPIYGNAENGSTITICWWDTRSESYKPF